MTSSLVHRLRDVWKRPLGRSPRSDDSQSLLLRSITDRLLRDGFLEMVLMRLEFG